MLERATGTTSNGATVALTGWVGIAWELLQTQTGRRTLLIAALGVVCDGLEFRVFFRVLGNQIVALEFALN